MIGEYRFLETKGHTYFARVKIEIEIISDGLEISEDFVGNSSDSSSDDYIPIIWIESAIEGLKASASVVFNNDENISGLRIIIKQIQWNFVDTTEMV